MVGRGQVGGFNVYCLSGSTPAAPRLHPQLHRHAWNQVYAEFAWDATVMVPHGDPPVQVLRFGLLVRDGSGFESPMVELPFTVTRAGGRSSNPMIQQSTCTTISSRAT